jgi:hypothetical protein
MEEQGASFEYWLLVRIWLIAPFIHSEVLADHELGRLMNEEVRAKVERF